MKKTVLHVAKYYYPTEGGIETVTKYMAEDLATYNNVVVCFNKDGNKQVETINGIKVYRVKTTFRISSQDIAFSYYRTLKRIINEYTPDIILVHCPNPFLYPIVCKLKPSPSKLVLLWHSDILGKGILYNLVSRYEQKILKKSDLILATSYGYIHPSSPIYKYKEKTRVVQNGIIVKDFERREGDEETIAQIKQQYGNKKIIFFVGRHCPYKGINLLIEAEQFIQSDCVILIGGRGPETDKLKAMTHSERIKFIGRVTNEELRCYYFASDIFGFTSCTKQEAFGIALAEAMYCGCVPVTFTIEGSGVNWVSVKGETGEEVPLGDVRAYATAVDKILNDDGLHEQYASACHERISKMFTSEQANKEADKIFNQLLGNT